MSKDKEPQLDLPWFPIEMMYDEEGNGPVPIEEAVKVRYAVWDGDCNEAGIHDRLADAFRQACTLNAQDHWHPPVPSHRPDGYECLTMFRQKWTHVKWSKTHGMWSLGYGRAFVQDEKGRLFAPLPAYTPEHDFFLH